MKFTNVIAGILLVIGLSSQAQADLNSNPTTSNPIMDGVISAGEWNTAGSMLDGNGLAGATYAMWQNGLNYGSWNYAGNFSFLLHNIEQNTTFSNGANPAFNVFDIYTPTDSINKYLEVTVRYDGFTVNKYNSSGSIIDTNSFTYGVDLAPDQTDSYNWDNYWGVYAKGGYGNSAFTSGLANAVDNNNQTFELAYLNPATNASSMPVRRSLKDPDQNRNWQLVTYLDVTVAPVPEPETYAMLMAGFGFVGSIARRRKYLIANSL